MASPQTCARLFFTKRLTTSCVDGWACFNADRVINITLSILKSPNEPCTRSLELTARLPGGARLVVNLSNGSVEGF